jgi:hypothetical protein
MQIKESRPETAKTKNLPLNNSNKLFVCLGHLYQRGSAGINTLEAKSLYDEQREIVTEILGLVDGGAA